MLKAMGFESQHGWGPNKLEKKLNNTLNMLSAAKPLTEDDDISLLKEITDALNAAEEITLEEDLSPDNPEGVPEKPIEEKPKKEKKGGKLKSMSAALNGTEEVEEKPKKSSKKEKDKSPDKEEKKPKTKDKEEKSDKPPKEKKPRGPRKDRPTILGYSATALCHWMGLNGYKFDDVRKVLNDNGCEEIADASIKTGLSDCKSEKYSKPAPVTSAEAKQIKAMVKG